MMIWNPGDPQSLEAPADVFYLHGTMEGFGNRASINRYDQDGSCEHERPLQFQQLEMLFKLLHVVIIGISPNPPICAKRNIPFLFVPLYLPEKVKEKQTQYQQKDTK